MLPRANNSSPLPHWRVHEPLGAPGCSPTTTLPSQLAVNPARTRSPGLCRRPNTDLPTKYPTHNSSSQRSIYRGTSPRHRSGNHPPTNYGCNREGQKTTFSKPYFSQAQKLGTMEIDPQSQEPQQKAQPTSLQDGRPPVPTVHSLQRRLDGQDRPQGRLPNSGSAGDVSQIPPIPLERGNLPIQSNAIWVEHSPLCVHETAEKAYSEPMGSKSSHTWTICS